MAWISGMGPLWSYGGEHTVPEHTSDYFQRANLTRYNGLS